jgi:hypothetical protein
VRVSRCPGAAGSAMGDTPEILQVRNRCQFMPSRRIFDSSVWRGIPSLAAAPDGPDTRPRLSASAASINSLSLSVEAVRREIAPNGSSRLAASARFHQA